MAAACVLYLVARHAGANLNVVATNLPDVWWRIPVLVLAAAENALLEEVLVAGYLVHRLGQLGWSPWKAVGASAILRGSYHLYQGLGGFVGNAVMGLLFARLYQRWGRVMPHVHRAHDHRLGGVRRLHPAQGPRLVDLTSRTDGSDRIGLIRGTAANPYPARRDRRAAT